MIVFTKDNREERFSIIISSNLSPDLAIQAFIIFQTMP